ncbi:MAG: hypothetical protein RJB59_283 [Actinomycetota bacterium]
MVFTRGREVAVGLGRGFVVVVGFGSHGIHGFFNRGVETALGFLLLLLPGLPF